MHIVEAKGILSAKNGMNLYRGCSHGCIYCDSRSRKKCLSPVKKYKLYKSSINKSIHFVQRSLSSSTRG